MACKDYALVVVERHAQGEVGSFAYLVEYSFLFSLCVNSNGLTKPNNLHQHSLINQKLRILFHVPQHFIVIVVIARPNLDVV
jgi:hypothetical protein